MKIGILDLEMSNLNADFGVLLCGVVKEYEGKRTVLRLDEMPGYKARPWDDKALAVKLRDTIAPYDIIVTYNGRRFDIPFLNTRLTVKGKPPLPRMKHVDLLYVARYGLKLHSASLHSVQQFLSLPDSKTEMQADRWIKALTGSTKDFDYIVQHCILDVDVLEEAYDKLKHLVRSIHT